MRTPIVVASTRMTAWRDTELSDADLRLNHSFVVSFEELRQRFGHREVDDGALRQIADATGTRFEDIRLARNLRNCLAHNEPVNRNALKTYLLVLRAALGDERQLPPTLSQNESQPRSAFRIHAWLDNRLEQLMIANGFVSLGGSEIGDLSAVDDPEQIRSTLAESMPERVPRAIGLFVGYWRRFLRDAQIGDLIVLPTRDGTIAIGEFTGEYQWVPDAEPHARHRRAVAWLGLGIERDAFERDLLAVINGRNTVQTFSGPEAAGRLWTHAVGH